MDNTAEEVDNNSEIVDNLMNMFGNVMNKDVIAAVVESCDGDLNQSIDAIMNMTEEGHGIENNNQDVPDNTDSPLPPVCDAQPTFSYATAIQNAPTPNPVDTKPKPVNRPAVPVVNFWTDQIRTIVANHGKGFRMLLIMRGVSGTGKSFLSKQLVEIMIGVTNNDYNNHVFCTDDFYLVRGQYRYDRFKLSEAHTWNQNRVAEAAKKGVSPIIVDNTNIEIWEMQPYIVEGMKNGYIIELVEPNTPWARNAGQLYKKNKHNVPYDLIRRKLMVFQQGLTSKFVIKKLGLRYPFDMIPPVIRSIPAIGLPRKDSETKPNSNKSNTENDSNEVIDTSNTDAGNLQVLNDTCLTENVIDETDENKNLLETATVNGEDISYEQQIRERSYSEAQKRIEEMEKVEEAWENGENWGEDQDEVSTTPNNNTSNESSVVDVTRLDPKPPRLMNYDENTDNNTVSTLMNSVNQCDDWSQISMFMPSWNDTNTSNIQLAEESPVQTAGSSTCMELDDTNSENGKYKILVATPRDINEFCMALPKVKIPSKWKLDKSTMTNEQVLTESFKCKNQEKHFIAFRKLFKNIARSDLRDIFDNCCGDVNWAVSIVLDGMMNSELKPCDEDDQSEPEEEILEQCECLAAYNVIPDVYTFDQPKIESKNPDSQSETVAPIIKKTKKDISPSEETLQLKRQIEQNVVIDDSHYSKQCLKIRKFRRGEVNDLEQPSTSGTQQVTQLVEDVDEVVISDDEISDDEFSIMSDGEETKMITMTLGRDFIKKLDSMFGRDDMEYPDCIEPTINMPLHILNELNALWMESFMHQMEKQAEEITKMIKEDEQLAKDLALKEAEAIIQGRPVEPDFKEIMDLDLAFSLYQKDVAAWRDKEPNDLAAKMSRDKLYNLFPSVDKSVLSELLMAHDNNFQSTVEVLLVSTGKTDVLEADNGVNKFIMEKELERQKAFLEEQKKVLSEEEWPQLPETHEMTMDVVNWYRGEAQEHLDLRNVNYNKARQCIQRGMTEVATYYSLKATFHKKRYEQANGIAAATLVQMHSQKSSETTVDLHYLRVREAKESLDMFIDSHIQKLRVSNGPRKNILFIITGRGLHSQGLPRVKPAIKQRLTERRMHFAECNPGLLSVKVRASDRMTYQLNMA